MEQNDKKNLGGRAAGLGFVAIFTYFAGYYVRYLLSVAAPELQIEGYSPEFVGLLSSLFFGFYATGQLFSGFLGDRIPAKYMALAGMCSAGVSTLVFGLFEIQWVQIAAFVLLGLGLSLLRGPLTKLVSESLPKDRAQLICTILFVFANAGPLVASALSLIFHWRTMFFVASGISFGTAALAFFLILLFERKGWVVFHPQKQVNKSSIRELFRLDGFVFYMIIGGITEIANSAITFWIPTYLSLELHLDEGPTNLLYMAAAILNAIAPFFTLMIYRLLKKRDVLLLRATFVIATAAFLLMIPNFGVIAKIVLLLIGKTALSFSAAVLWSIFVPGMGATGHVSSISGLIDCSGYVATALANLAFGFCVGANWTVILILWAGIAGAGLVASFVRRQKNTD